MRQLTVGTLSPIGFLAAGALALLAALALADGASGTALPVVNADTGLGYPTIQAAVDDALPGHTLLVRAGSYDEDVVVDLAALALCASAADACSLQPAAAVLQGTLTLSARDARVSGLTVEGLVNADAPGAALRGNRLLGGLASDQDVDARGNDWGVYDWQAVRALVAGSGDVTQVPFRTADGSLDPPAPTVVPGTHCSSLGFQPLSLTEALWCAHPGGVVLAHPSLNLADPTPYLEKVTIDRNRDLLGVDAFGAATWGAEVESLDGVMLCSAAVGALDCDDPQPSLTILDSSTYGAPVVDMVAPGAHVKGFTLRGADPLLVGGGDDPRASFNTFEMRPAVLNGVVLTGATGGAFDSNTFLGDLAVDSEAFELTGSAGTELALNVIDGMHRAIQLEDSTGVLVRGNRVLAPSLAAGGQATIGLQMRDGQDHRSQFNLFEGVGVAVDNAGSQDYASYRDELVGTDLGFRLRPLLDQRQPTGASIRFSDLGLSGAPVIALDPQARDLVVDARNNNWGTDDWRTIAPRILDQGIRNLVLYVPFIRASDEVQDPPAVTVIGATSHCGELSPEVSIQEAIDCAHPGETILVAASDNLLEPVPHVEAITITANSLGEQLDGLSLCSTPPGGAPEGDPCGAPDHDAIIDATVSANTVATIGANDVLLRGFTLRHNGPADEDLLGVALLGQGPMLLDNAVSMEGGGCTAADIVAGTCFDPARVRGVEAFGAIANAQLLRNSIRADLVSAGDGSIGGTEGIRGNFDDSLLRENFLMAWANVGAFVWGDGLTLFQNTFDTNSGGVAFCTGLGQMNGEENVFDRHLAAVLITACSDARGDGVFLRENRLGLTNAFSLEFRPGSSQFTVDGRLNDWGVYDFRLLPARVNDLGQNNHVRQLPFLDDDDLPEPPLPQRVDPETGEVLTFLSIQEAIDAAPEGETVLIPSGTLVSTTLPEPSPGGPGQAAATDVVKGGRTPYFEELDLSRFVSMCQADPSRTPPRCGSDPNNITIDANGLDDFAIEITAAGVTIEGFTILNSGLDGPGGSIYIGAADVTIHNNVIDGNLPDPTGAQGELGGQNVVSPQGQVGVLVSEAATAYTISANVIREWDSAAIHVVPGAGGPGTIVGNVIQANLADAVLIENADPTAAVHVLGNEIGPNVNYAVNLRGSAGSVIEANTLMLNPTNGGRGTGSGVWINGATGTRLVENTFRGNAAGSVLVTNLVDGESVLSTPDDLVFRGNRLGLAGGDAPAITIAEEVSNLIVDARLNRWGTDDWRLIPPQIMDRGTDTDVLFIPFLRFSDDLPDPPAPDVPQPALDLCADELLSLQDAIDCAGPGGTVLVRPSRNALEPTPWLESVRIDEAGVSLCSAPFGVEDCSTPAAGSVIDNARGDAVSIAGNDVTVRGLTLRSEGAAGVVLATGAHNAAVLDNRFVGHAAAVRLVGLPGPRGVLELHGNDFGLLNERGLELAAETAGLLVEAECNDWGVYDLVSIHATRVADEGTLNQVDVDPWLVPGQSVAACGDFLPLPVALPFQPMPAPLPAPAVPTSVRLE